MVFQVWSNFKLGNNLSIFSASICVLPSFNMTFTPLSNQTTYKQVKRWWVKNTYFIFYFSFCIYIKAKHATGTPSIGVR